MSTNIVKVNKQLSELLLFVEEEINKGKKVILGGDFNLEPASPKYQKVTSLLIDQTLILRPLANFNKTFPQKDFIFTSTGTSKDHKKIEYPIYFSDHPGLGLSISL